MCTAVNQHIAADVQAFGARWAARLDARYAEVQISGQFQTDWAQSDAEYLEALEHALLPGSDEKLRNYAAKLLTVRMIRETATQATAQHRLEVTELIRNALIEGNLKQDKTQGAIDLLDFAEELVAALHGSVEQQREVRAILHPYL